MMSVRNRERVLQNERLVKSIAEIQKRRRHYIDILDKRVDGQNIYFLVGHTRANIFQGSSFLHPGSTPKEALKIAPSEFG
jgi:hypothetical protein